jgi:hypothetical protein
MNLLISLIENRLISMDKKMHWSLLILSKIKLNALSGGDSSDYGNKNNAIITSHLYHHASLMSQYYYLLYDTHELE